MIPAIMGFTRNAVDIIVNTEGGWSADSITPAGASVIPGAAPIVGADGQLLSVSQQSEDLVNYKAYIAIKGPWFTPAQLPFTTLTVRDSVVFNKSELTATGPVEGGYRFETNTGPKRMLVPGANKFKFT